MRKVMEKQMRLGEIDISQLRLNDKRKDEMEKILKGLQYIYNSFETREKIFSYLETIVSDEVDRKNGRPGMHLWKIFVLAIIRLGKGCDLNSLWDYADNHYNVRAMMGHTSVDDRTSYNKETIRRNMQLFTPEVIDSINKIIVDAGHKIVLKKNEKMDMRYWWGCKVKQTHSL